MWHRAVVNTLVLVTMITGYSPPRRGGVAAPSEAQAQTAWSDRRNVSAELTTPARLLLRLRPIGLALRATPPLRGGESSQALTVTVALFNVQISVASRQGRLVP